MEELSVVLIQIWTLTNHSPKLLLSTLWTPISFKFKLPHQPVFPLLRKTYSQNQNGLFPVKSSRSCVPVSRLQLSLEWSVFVWVAVFYLHAASPAVKLSCIDLGHCRYFSFKSEPCCQQQLHLWHGPTSQKTVKSSKFLQGFLWE